MLTKHEYGKIIYVNVGADISTATEAELLFTKPDGTTLSKLLANGVSIPTDPVTADCEIYAANEYLSYTFINGDIDQDGDWNVRSRITMGGKYLVGKNALMVVNP